MPVQCFFVNWHLKIVKVFLTHGEVSAQEAVFCLLGLTMLSRTVKRVFEPLDMPDNRIRILKVSRHLETLDTDSEDIYMTALVQRYATHPSSLDTVCWPTSPWNTTSATQPAVRRMTTMITLFSIKLHVVLLFEQITKEGRKELTTQSPTAVKHDNIITLILHKNDRSAF